VYQPVTYDDMNRFASSGPSVQSRGGIRWKPIADSGSLDIGPRQMIVNIDQAAATLLNCDQWQTVGSNVWDVLCTSLPAYHHQVVNAAITNRERSVIRTRLSSSNTPVFLTVVPKANGLVNITISKIS
jgi:hypothetical protein